MSCASSARLYEAEVLPALAEFVEQVDEPPAVYLGREHDGAPSRVLRGGSGGGRKQRGEAPVRGGAAARADEKRPALRRLEIFVELQRRERGKQRRLVGYERKQRAEVRRARVGLHLDAALRV